MKDQNQAAVSIIKELRTARHISQNTIAKALNITQTAYNRIENGKTQLTVNLLFAIAAVLEVSVYRLLASCLDYINSSPIRATYNNGFLTFSINTEQLKTFLSAK